MYVCLSVYVVWCASKFFFFSFVGLLFIAAPPHKGGGGGLIIGFRVFFSVLRFYL